VKWLHAVLLRLLPLRRPKLKCLLARPTRARMWLRAFRLWLVLLRAVRVGLFRA
jgi:hypothetical protein